jgi:hypothetical protein
MSNEKTVRPPCDACGAESCASDAGQECSYEDGYYFCAKHWLESSVKNRELIAARRQRTAEPRFVDRNGVELHLGDVIRCDWMQDIAIVALYRRETFGRIETIADAPREPGSSAPRRASNLEKFWTRIDPPADEPNAPAPCQIHVFDDMTQTCACGVTRKAYVQQLSLRGEVIKAKEMFERGWSRQTLIEALLSESGHVPPTYEDYVSYGDFERDRVTRMVDAQAAMLARLERDLGMVAMLGPMFAVTPGDCEP